MLTRDRSKRKYGFGDLTAPTKLEVLEIIERGNWDKMERVKKIDKHHVSYFPEIVVPSTVAEHRRLHSPRHGGKLLQQEYNLFIKHLVKEAEERGVTLSRVAKEHHMNSSPLYNYRRGWGWSHGKKAYRCSE